MDESLYSAPFLFGQQQRLQRYAPPRTSAALRTYAADIAQPARADHAAAAAIVAAASIAAAAAVAAAAAAVAAATVAAVTLPNLD